MTVEIVNALQPNVKDNKDPLARQVKTEVRALVTGAGENSSALT